MTRHAQVLIVAATFVVVGCGGDDESAEPPAFSPAEAVADAAEAEPAISAAPDSTVDEVPASPTVESSGDDAVVTTGPPVTIATGETSPPSSAPATTEPPATTQPPAAAEPVDETEPEPSAPLVSAADIADLEAQLDEIDALLTDLELDLEQD